MPTRSRWAAVPSQGLYRRPLHPFKRTNLPRIMRYIGKEMRRVDGVAKVTGLAKYAAEFPLPEMAYGCLELSTIAKGTITKLDVSAAEKSPGVLKVISH